MGVPMDRKEIEAIFDHQAASYDQQWATLAPLREALQLLLGAVFAELPADARVLCVGAGTGQEIVSLAQRFPQFRFTAVEPSATMIDVCRQRVEEEGIAARCAFHHGYVESLPAAEPFDAATCFLVSQFIVDVDARIAFFRDIAERLRPGGCLASSDLAADIDSAEYRSLLDVWLRVMTAGAVSADMVERIRTAYGRDVAVLAPERVRTIIAAAGFEAPVQFYQGGLIHGWYARRTAR
jgi:tRNA (cmo5U34)-methyltransferase